MNNVFSGLLLNSEIPYLQKNSSIKHFKGRKSSNVGNLTIRSVKETYQTKFKKIKEFTSSVTGMFVRVSSNLDDIDEPFFDQGLGTIEPKIDGLVANQPIQFVVTTNKEISIAQILTLDVDFIIDYQDKIDDYQEELAEQLTSVCQEIMMEEDSNLADNSIKLKKKLLKIFSPS